MKKKGITDDMRLDGAYSCDSEKLTVMASTGGVWNWENVTCPICLESPHNAVLLQCSSYKQGCRPYICNTSYRHSNCLDKFVRSSAPCPSARQVEDVRSDEGGVASSEGSGSQATPPCPFCRGEVLGWFVDKNGRVSMDSKARACSFESCDFSGTYMELRKHARTNHPSARPSDVDPERQEKWSIMERQNELSELLRMIIPETYYEEEDYYDSLVEEDTGEPMPSGLFGMVYAAADVVTNSDTYTQIIAAALLFPALGFDNLGAHNIIISAENSSGNYSWAAVADDWNNNETRHEDNERLGTAQSTTTFQRDRFRRRNANIDGVDAMLVNGNSSRSISLVNTVNSHGSNTRQSNYEERYRNRSNRGRMDSNYFRSNRYQRIPSHGSVRQQRLPNNSQPTFDRISLQTRSSERPSRRWSPYNHPR